MRVVDVYHNGKLLCQMELEDDLIKGLSEDEIQDLCKGILWEETIHKLLGKTEVWCNPWKRKK